MSTCLCGSFFLIYLRLSDFVPRTFLKHLSFILNCVVSSAPSYSLIAVDSAQLNGRGTLTQSSPIAKLKIFLNDRYGFSFIMLANFSINLPVLVDRRQPAASESAVLRPSLNCSKGRMFLPHAAVNFS